MIKEKEIKVWETAPIPFASLMQKLFAFCLEHNVAPDDLMIAPYNNYDHNEVTEMGIRISIINRES